MMEDLDFPGDDYLDAFTEAGLSPTGRFRHPPHVVARASLAKFTSTPRLYRELLATKDHILVEASPTDDVWGVKLHENDPAVHDRSRWRGTNWLGQVLTDLREHLLAVHGLSRTRK